jgi:hypothetical protein
LKGVSKDAEEKKKKEINKPNQSSESKFVNEDDGGILFSDGYVRLLWIHLFEYCGFQ